MKTVVVFIMTSLANFFYLGISFNKVHLIFACFLLSAMCWQLYRNEIKNIILTNRFFIIYIFGVVISSIIIFLFTMMSFNQNISSTLSVAYPYFLIVLAIPLLCIFLRENDYNSVFRVLNCFAFIWYVLVLVQSIIFPRIILPSYFVNAETSLNMYYRSNRLRMDLQMYGNLMIIYNFYMVYVNRLPKKYKIWNWLLLALGLYELIIIQQTRMYILCVAFCLLVIIITYGKGLRGLTRRIVVLLLVAVMISQTTYVTDILNSIFSSASELFASTRARLYSLTYYLNYYKTHPIFGFGFINGSLHPDIVHGELGYAYIDDVGIVGQLVRLGIFVVPIYFVLIIRFFKTLMLIKLYSENKEFVFFSMLFAYIIVTSATLIMLDSQRILLYPVSFSVFEFKKMQIMSQKNRMRKDAYEK